jgi:hypothetical protein
MKINTMNFILLLRNSKGNWKDTIDLKYKKINWKKILNASMIEMICWKRSALNCKDLWKSIG